MKGILKPRSERAKMDFASLADNFSDAVEAVKKFGIVDLSAMGMDWNTSVLKSNGGGILYNTGNVYSNEGERVSGKIKNCGRGEIGIRVANPRLIGKYGLANDDIVRSLAEAVGYTAKLDILEGVEFLPSGEVDGVRFAQDNDFSRVDYNDVDIVRHNRFRETLTNEAKRIITARNRDGSFDKYTVVEMPSGAFVAYCSDQNEAPYVVLDIDALTQDKQTIRKNRDAITFRRDARGDWEKRVMEAVA
jgi:hypothetical protein|tara:strand:+ start:302 stop:1042 length:741 start_codon:yes stop_codon:yes gene_type:complete